MMKIYGHYMLAVIGLLITHSYIGECQSLSPNTQPCVLNSAGYVNDTAVKLLMTQGRLLEGLSRALECSKAPANIESNNSVLAQAERFCAVQNDPASFCWKPLFSSTIDPNQPSDADLTLLAMTKNCPQASYPRLPNCLTEALCRNVTVLAEGKTTVALAKQILKQLQPYYGTMPCVKKMATLQSFGWTAEELANFTIGLDPRTDVFTIIADLVAKLRPNQNAGSLRSLPADLLLTQTPETIKAATEGAKREEKVGLAATYARLQEQKRLEVSQQMGLSPADRAAKRLEEVAARKLSATDRTIADLFRPVSELNQDDMKAILASSKIANCFGINELKNVSQYVKCLMTENGVDPYANLTSEQQHILREQCARFVVSDPPKSLKTRATPSDITSECSNMSLEQLQAYIELFSNVSTTLNGQQIASLASCLRAIMQRGYGVLTADAIKKLRVALTNVTLTDILPALKTSDDIDNYCKQMGSVPFVGPQAREVLLYCLSSSTVSACELGDLLHEIVADDVTSKLTDSDVTTCLSILGHKVLDRQARRSLLDRYIALKQGFSKFTTSDFQAMSSLVTELLPAEISELESHINFGRSLYYIALELKAQHERTLMGEGTDYLTEALELARQSVIPAAVTASRLASGQSGGRKKRSTTSGDVDCTTLESVDASQLSVAQLQNLSSNVFTSCPAKLNVDGYDEEKLTTVAQKATETLETSCWTEETVRDLGVVVLGLSLDSLTCTNLTGNDSSIISSIGRHTTLLPAASTRYQNVFTQWKIQAKVSRLDASTITILGSVACGMNMQDASKIPNGDYDLTSAQIGGWDCFSPEVYTAFAQKAVYLYNYGYPTNISEATIQAIGSVAAGLSIEFYSGLTVDLMPYVTSSAIKNIPLKSFAEINESALEGLSGEQAMAVPSNILKRLTQSQQDVILRKRSAIYGSSMTTTGDLSSTTAGLGNQSGSGPALGGTGAPVVGNGSASAMTSPPPPGALNQTMAGNPGTGSSNVTAPPPYGPNTNVSTGGMPGQNSSSGGGGITAAPGGVVGSTGNSSAGSPGGSTNGGTMNGTTSVTPRAGSGTNNTVVNGTTAGAAGSTASTPAGPTKVSGNASTTAAAASGNSSQGGNVPGSGSSSNSDVGGSTTTTTTSKSTSTATTTTTIPPAPPIAETINTENADQFIPRIAQELSPQDIIGKLDNGVLADPSLVQTLASQPLSPTQKLVVQRKMDDVLRNAPSFNPALYASAGKFVTKKFINRLTDAEILKIFQQGTVSDNPLAANADVLQLYGDRFGDILMNTDGAKIVDMLSAYSSRVPGIPPDVFTKIIKKTVMNDASLAKLSNVNLRRPQAEAVYAQYLANNPNIIPSKMTSAEIKDHLEHIPVSLRQALKYWKFLDGPTYILNHALTMIQSSRIVTNDQYKEEEKGPGPAELELFDQLRRKHFDNLTEHDKYSMVTSELSTVESVKEINSAACSYLQDQYLPVQPNENPGQLAIIDIVPNIGDSQLGAMRAFFEVCKPKDGDVCTSSIGSFMALATAEELRVITADRLINTGCLKRLCYADWTGRRAQLDVLLEKVRSYLDSDTTNNLGSIYSKIPCLLPFMQMRHISQLASPADKKAVCEIIACQSCNTLPQTMVADSVQFCATLAGELQTDFSCPNRKGNCFLRSLTASTSFNCDLVKGRIDFLSQAVVNCDARQKLFQCIKEDFSVKDAKNVALYGTLVDQFSDTEWREVAKAGLCGMLGQVSEVMAQWEMEERRARKEGWRLASRCVNKEKVIDRLLEAERSPDCTAVGNPSESGSSNELSKRRRRKRSSSASSSNALTYDEIQQLGDNIITVSVAQLQSIPIEDFLNAAVQLGLVKGFREDQWAALAGLAKKVYGSDTSQWTDEQLIALAGMISGLSPAENGNLKFRSVEAAAAVGNNGLWNGDKLMQAFSSFKQTWKNGNVSALTTSELNAIGNLACGIAANEISRIQAAQFCGAMSTVGSLETCEPSQLTEYAMLAKKCIGIDPTAWTISQIISLGANIGGLSKEELQLLNTEQVQAIPEVVIPLIPPTQFAGFTKAQLSAMSTNQLAVVTQTQYQSLESDKQNVITQKLATVSADLSVDPTDANGKGSGCNAATASILPILTAVLGLFVRL